MNITVQHDGVFGEKNEKILGCTVKIKCILAFGIALENHELAVRVVSCKSVFLS